MCVVQLIKGDMDEEVLLRERHILVHLRSSRQSTNLEGGKVDITTNLKSIIEISNLAQIVQKLVDPCFVVFDEGIQCDHVGFLRIRRFVRQILEHFGDLRGSRSANRSNLEKLPEPNCLQASKFALDASPGRHQLTYTPGV